MHTCFKDKTCLAMIAVGVKEVTCDKQSFERQKKLETDVRNGTKRELLKSKWKLKKWCDKETHLLITESTEVARSRCQVERGGATAMKERGRETDRRVRAPQMVLSEDKESYLVVVDAPEPGHASLLLTTARSAVTQCTSLLG